MDLHPLLQQIRGVCRSADTVEERAIGVRVTAAELRLNRRPITPTGTIDLSKNATERGEEDIWGDWRGTAPQQAPRETPCGACGEQIIDRHRFAFEGWIAHTECAVDNVQGASDRREDRFGVIIRGRNGPSRRKTCRLTEIMPRLHQRYDSATEWGMHRRGQLARSWSCLLYTSPSPRD